MTRPPQASRLATHERTERVLGKLLGLLARRHLREVAHEHLLDRGQDMAVYAEDFVSREITVDGRFERQTLDVVLAFVTSLPGYHPGAMAIDVGANLGNHAICFARWFATVWAFEAHPRTLHLLRFNASVRSEIRVYGFALGAREETRAMRDVPANHAQARITPRGNGHDAGHDAGHRAGHREEAFTVQVRPLDALADEVHDLFLLKIDVEGMEAEVLEGALGILRTHRPVVAFELTRDAFAGDRGVPAAVAVLRDLGYSFATIVVEDGDLPAWHRTWRQARNVLRGVWKRRVHLVACDLPPEADHDMVVAIPDGVARRTPLTQGTHTRNAA